MAQSITLTASMRSNLSSLKSIQKQMDTTQERLSTGKKVNSAIDNASSYYQSRSLTNRAADLDSLLDSMGQGIQTIQAANEGIEAITSFIEQAKSVANSAFALDPTAADYAAQVNAYQQQFNSIVAEINTLAQDSSYQGVNLLTGNNLTVMFNETRTHSLTVTGKNVVTDMAAGTIGFTNADWLSTANVTAINTALNALYNTATSPAVSDQATLDSAIAAGGKVYAQYLDTNTGMNYWKEETTYDSTALAHKHSSSTPALETAYNAALQAVSTAVNTTLSSITKAVDYLRDFSSDLGNNYAIIQTRQDFTEALIDVLETGSDNLVLADMNEESANYLALQTRQQLAINSLALASQSAQSVLSLF